MKQDEIKVGQKVNAESAKGVRPGVVSEINPGPRGAFVKVNHGDAGTQQYRPAKLTKA